MTTDLHAVTCCGSEIWPALEQLAIGRVLAVWICDVCGAKAVQRVGWIEPSEAEIEEPAELVQ